MTLDKPLECSGCHEPAAIIYKQLCGDQCHKEILCKDCPLIQQRLEGKNNPFDATLHLTVACEGCGTLLQSVLRNEPLGCAHCYDVFEQAICQRLNCEKLEYNQEPMINKNPSPSPTSDQLLKLSKDLQEAVVTENFEKAALIRDEITKLKNMMSE